jgi:hypothetical protein
MRAEYAKRSVLALAPTQPGFPRLDGYRPREHEKQTVGETKQGIDRTGVNHHQELCWFRIHQVISVVSSGWAAQ